MAVGRSAVAVIAALSVTAAVGCGGAQKPSQKEVRMAGQLVGTLADDFEPSSFEDSYRDAVLDLIKRKSKGEEIDLAAEEEPAQGDDLAAALEASLSGARS